MQARPGPCERDTRAQCKPVIEVLEESERSNYAGQNEECGHQVGIRSGTKSGEETEWSKKIKEMTRGQIGEEGVCEECAGK